MILQRKVGYLELYQLTVVDFCNFVILPKPQTELSIYYLKAKGQRNRGCSLLNAIQAGGCPYSRSSILIS